MAEVKKLSKEAALRFKGFLPLEAKDEWSFVPASFEDERTEIVDEETGNITLEYDDVIADFVPTFKIVQWNR